MSDGGRHNTEIWRSGDFVADYATRRLSAAEAAILVRYRTAFAGRVLELGSGAGRVTGYLLELGGDVLGIDISPAMVEHARREYPAGTFRVQDLRDLDAFAAETYDAVVAANNLLDVLDDDGRRRVLAEIERILTPGGLLVMSSHNRAFAPRIPGPLAGAHGPRALLGVPRRALNRRRLRRHERDEPGYAIRVDEAHDYRLLHYYIDRTAQERQLADAGLELLECIDRDGGTVAAGETAAEHSELYYVARRGSRASA